MRSQRGRKLLVWPRSLGEGDQGQWKTRSSFAMCVIYQALDNTFQWGFNDDEQRTPSCLYVTPGMLRRDRLSRAACTLADL